MPKQKHDICKVYIMVDFICLGLVELQGTQIEQEIQHDETFLRD